MQFRAASAASVVPVILVAGLLAAAAGPRAAADDSDDSDDARRRDVDPFLRQWCFQCHAGEKVKGDLDLEKVLASTADAASTKDMGETWRNVKRRLRRHEMPPKKAPQPPSADADRAVAWIDGRIGVSSAGPADPGRVTLRRLSRFEYRCTVKDLTGVDFDAETRLPADDSGYGFDDIGDVMTLPPSLMEKYLAAAEDIANRALPAEDPAPRRFEAENLAGHGSFYRFGEWRGFWTNGEVHADVRVPRDGDYVVRVRACGLPAGPDPVRMAIGVDDKTAQMHDVTATRAEPGVLETKVRLARGRHAIGAAFVNDWCEPSNPDKSRSDRVLLLDWVELEGPVGDATPRTEFERALFGDDAGRPRDAAFAREVVKRIADRAFRRPATGEEVERLAGLVALSQKDGGSFARGVRLALTAALASPHFLFRVETDPAPHDPKAAHDLTDFEIATRLSYLLWSSLPDDELFAAAAKGTLHDRATLAGETRRMLADPRAIALVRNFAAQWLELRRLDIVAPDPERFPSFDEALRASMRGETERFVEALIRENRPLHEFLDADFTFVDARLAAHYGFPPPPGAGFHRVKLDPAQRGGLLTQASILTLTSNPTRTSPVKRGKFILEEILADPPAPPPPGVGAFDESDASARTATLRQRLARHRSDPNCVGCHTRMDALGFALENFDAVGAWRDRDGAQPVDSVGTLEDGRTFSGPAELRRVLLSDDSFVRCLAERLTIYAIGRGPTPEDRAAVDRLLETLPGMDATFADLVLGVVEMDGFRRRRGEDGPR